VLSLSLELMIDASLTEVARGRKLLRLIKRHVPEALAAEGAVIRLDPGEPESYLTIDVDPLQVLAERMVAFAEAACARYPVVYGHVHLMTETDRTRFGPDGGDEPYPLLAADVIARGLPTLFWATVLGPGLVDRIGRERVLSTPAARVSEPATGTVVLQLTDHAETLVEDAAAFDAARQAAQRHLGEDLFYASASPPAAKEHHQGDARTAADLLRILTDYAVESLLETGSIAPYGVAVPASGQLEWISTYDVPDDKEVKVIAGMIRAITGERTVVLAALCDEDASRHTNVPDARYVIRIRVEARGESPFVYFQPIIISDAGARLEEGWTEPAQPALLAEP
jgi:hypothetical protein